MAGGGGPRPRATRGRRFTSPYQRKEGPKNYTKLDVLLIEDNPDDVALALRALKKHDFISTIHVASDGAEALEHIFGSGTPFEPRLPTVILLDLKLPKIGGLEVL